jgi:hypothetical protein
MLDPNASPSARLRAADSVLNHAAKAIEMEDIEARVSDLEHAAEVAKARVYGIAFADLDRDR